jgi:threonine aldolase
MAVPPAPERTFSSDNAAGIHPRVLDAIARANRGHAVAYGDDDQTRACERRFDALFGRPVATYLTFNGTGANVMALMAIARPGDAVICTESAHINVDETGAPERVAGVKLIDVPSHDGKLRPEQIEREAHALGVPHHAQPAIVSITQCTELGTVYHPDEVVAICETAHRHGMRVHMDGARIANAVAAHGGDVAALRALTVDAGVDVLTFGGTKNGMLGGEAVVFLDPAAGARGHYIRKTVTQLASKMRFVAAQFNALLDDGLWLDLAGHSNAMARRLYQATAGIAGVDAGPLPAVNSMFPLLDPVLIAPLQSWSFFWDWDASRGQVRWMTAWDTTPDDVDTFASGVATFVATHN